MRVELWNRQRAVPVTRARLEQFAAQAADRILALPPPVQSDLAKLATVEISVVSDREIAKVHRQFLHIRGATDVITFAHGEIVLSAATAARAALANADTTDREIARYIVHGLLHLHGHDDVTPQSAQRMWKMQEDVLKTVWPHSQRPGIASKR